jgi:mannose-6-phosphate isomerase
VLYPLTFHPIFKERVWGGRKLATLYAKSLPADAPIGESWEVSDRPGDASVILNGALAGKDLRWLMEHHERDVLGDAQSQNGLFPLLIKILDARDRLSLQVHPPAHSAAALGGDPKTEMWHITHAEPGAELYVGLRKGVTRADFERRLQDGSVEECFHRIRVKSGDTMFLPSGRVHAIGAGLVLFEIQQNSDTTYRVFDWNRLGTDGKPRALHVEQSLASIDFNDFEPGLVTTEFNSAGRFKVRPLSRNSLFGVDLFRALAPETISFKQSRLKIVGSVEGTVVVRGSGVEITLRPAEFCLIPAALASSEVVTEIGSTFLLVQPGA